MNIKKSLSALIILTMIFTGCSSYQVKEEAVSLPDKATKQKTMTKVQNNINEIIGKDYEYVLSNLGEPNATAYWIDKDTVDKIHTLDNIENIGDVNLVYLKNVSNENNNSSALYLQLEDNNVKKVQIVDYSSLGIKKSLVKSKILVNCYTDGEIVNIDTLKDKKLDDYIGLDISGMEKIVGNKKASYDAYLFDKLDKSINVYELDNNKLLVIFTEQNKISNIKIISDVDDIIDTIKDEVLSK